MRVVLDTNILVSALLSPNGPPRSIVSLARAGFITPFVSPAILAEYSDVLARAKFKQTEDVLADFLSPFFLPHVCVYPDVPRSVCIDPDDNRFIECAEAANARFLITGNLRHFPREFEQIRVVSASDFLAHLTISL